MDKPNFPEKQTTTSWGTWEELLLACAVHRYGTHSWDSVATELCKRSSSLQQLSPQTCKRKYHDLLRRFSQKDAVLDANANDDAATPIPWLDQLRQLRLDELRLELQRYDHSIVSLQLKVERLKEVREQSLRESDKSLEKSDPERTREEEEIKIEDEDKHVEQENVSPESGKLAAKDISGEASMRDDRSFDKSNTTDPKPEAPETGVVAEDKDSEPAEPASGEVGPCGKASGQAVENSCNGSSDSVTKEPVVRESEKAANSGELRESVAESKGGEEGTKESQSSSEVQSSASLSRKTGSEQKPAEPDRPDEQEDQSPAMKPVPSQSQPLVDFFEIVRSHKAASFFERRLHYQDTPIYMNMIRQHIDFGMVQTRLEGDCYSGCSSNFFRDLLLICSNAKVFFRRKSPEYKAACELQSLVSKERALKAPKLDPSPKEETPTPPKEETPIPPKEETPAPTASHLNLEPESSDSLLAKSKLSIPLNACRKRSSITARASTSSSGQDSKGPDRQKEQTTTSFRDVKPAINWKQKEESLDEVEKLHVTKKRRKERLRSSSRNNSTKNGRSRSNTKTERNSDAKANSNVGFSSRGVTSTENSESKAETERKGNNNASGKKRSAANFLSRMKRNSSNNGSLLETVKTPEAENNSKGGVEQRKNGNGKGTAQKDQASRRGSGGRQAEKEQGSAAKRSVGRPSKRATVAPTTSVPAKRRR